MSADGDSRATVMTHRGEGNGAALRDITRRYYAMWWGYAFAGGFLYGVYPLFLRSRGLDQFEINSVLGVLLRRDVSDRRADRRVRRRDGPPALVRPGLRDARRRLHGLFFRPSFPGLRGRRVYRRDWHDAVQRCDRRVGRRRAGRRRLRRNQGPALLAHFAADQLRLHGRRDNRRLRRRFQYCAAVDAGRGRLLDGRRGRRST